MRRALAGLLAIVAAAPAAAQAETCSGERVTLSGAGRIVGTAERDVILGSNEGDVIVGGGGEDVICGGGGNDVIDGGPGRDELLGQGDSDAFRGRDLAQDVITGGTGDLDVADYRRTPAGIRLNIGTHQVKADGARFTGGLLGIEVVVGTAFDDHLTGGRGEDDFRGREGNDVVDGRAGRDRLEGGDGTDTVTFEQADKPVRLSVEGRDAVSGGVRDNVEEFEAYVGSRFDDRLVGGNTSERLEGGPGDDTLKGFEDGDNLLGGPGDDTLFPGTGDDFVDGGANGPVRGTGAPGDLVSYHGEKSDIGGATSFNFEAYLNVNGFLQNPAHAEGVGYDLLEDVESVRAPKDAMSYLEGNEGANVLIGSFRIDSIEGLGGNDLLFGLGSNDNLGGGPGDDFLDGGGGGSNKLDGGDGDDTCLNGPELQTGGCETTG